MKYKIEKNIETPASVGNKYPFGEMEVGDSFKFPKSEIYKIRTAASFYGKRKNKKFTVRKINNEEFRVWRIK